ncbi:DUF2865 domain-containing protein [Mesorhizobium comanense]|uniref:DUF2865 domain-containing protein n=1 Tax=Mesorhizobium comanense TaxID=2502215 RepID=UPI0010F52783|nr:DUF2865 domain-containing protein [Mesorhizobium comanense]
MTRFWFLITSMLAVGASLTLGSTSSRADSCEAVKSQLISAGHAGGASPELAQLRRQLMAIQGLERQRKCTAQSAAGGFFNACADLARNRVQVQRQMASVSGRDLSGLQARFAALGCSPGAKDARGASKAQSEAGSLIGGGTMLFCVRLSDGYFFPAPKSQFATGGDIKDMADQCRYICADPAVDLYTLGDASLETEKMVALDTRKPYTELPTAFRYRDNADFKACDIKRYYQRVAELRARTVTPTNMANAIIPLPQSKPDLGSVAAIGEPVGEAPGAAQHGSVDATKRSVRVVGPAFFPSQ